MASGSVALLPKQLAVAGVSSPAPPGKSNLVDLPEKEKRCQLKAEGVPAEGLMLME